MSIGEGISLLSSRGAVSDPNVQLLSGIEDEDIIFIELVTSNGPCALYGYCKLSSGITQPDKCLDKVGIVLQNN